MTLRCMDCGLPVYTAECKPANNPGLMGCGHPKHCSCASADDDILDVEI